MFPDISDNILEPHYCVIHGIHMKLCYDGRLKSSWTHLITPSWRCGDSPFFKVPPLTSNAVLTALHPLLENVLQTVCYKLQEGCGAGSFDLSHSFLHL